jgi:hypothetical protein
MGRWRQRFRLEDGLKLDINRLIRRGNIQPGSKTHAIVSWPKLSASCDLTAELSYPMRGWMRLEFGSLDQWVELVSLARHYGGRQWYFLCPQSGRRVSVLWMPPGARSFKCRQSWGRQVAYGSQFQSPYHRAGSAAQTIRYRLVGADNPESEGELPPKPKGMHWRTYEREIERIEAYENASNFYLLQSIAGLF